MRYKFRNNVMREYAKLVSILLLTSKPFCTYEDIISLPSSDVRTVFLCPPFTLAKTPIYEFPTEKDRG